MPVLTTWTDDRTDRLRSLWKEGYTCSQIAADLGFTTRNAVIGKVHRLRISDEAPTNKAHVPRKFSPAELVARKEKLNARRREARRAARPEFPCRPQRPEICVEVDPLNITLTDLQQNDCRWPSGDSPFVFCGHPKFHGSYCTAHYFASVGQGTASERAADKVSKVHLTGAA